VVAVALGIGVLHERVQADGVEWALIAVLVGVMTAATLALARSAARAAPDARAGVPAPGGA
jgi:F0F1-type ATP synthase assembly protein I